MSRISLETALNRAERLIERLLAERERLQPGVIAHREIIRDVNAIAALGNECSERIYGKFGRRLKVGEDTPVLRKMIGRALVEDRRREPLNHEASCGTHDGQRCNCVMQLWSPP